MKSCEICGDSPAPRQETVCGQTYHYCCDCYHNHKLSSEERNVVKTAVAKKGSTRQNTNFKFW